MHVAADNTIQTDHGKRRDPHDEIKVDIKFGARQTRPIKEMD